MARKPKTTANGNGAEQHAGDVYDPEAKLADRGVLAEPQTGHNKEPLTDEQQAALGFQHKKAYEAALAVKKTADASFKNVCKLAKAEMGDDAVDTIKDMIAAETEEGEAKLKARIERALKAARWMAVPLGAQSELFAEPDRMPAVDRARAEGKRDGMAGKTLKSPYDQTLPQNEAYHEGWQEGQKAIFAIQRGEDGALFDAAEGETETQLETAQ